MYLTPIDYKALLREDVREMIEGEDTSRLPQAEAAAYGFMQHTWNKRHAIAEIFIPCPEHKTDQAYTEGSLVYWRSPAVGEDEAGEYKVFTALQNTNSTPVYDGNEYWSESDPRDQYVIELMLSITVFNFFKAEATHAIPEIVQKLRDEARKDIMMIGKGELLANLPLRVDEDESKTGDIRWNSQPKEINRW